jgi:hypothetical protein
MKRRGPPLTNHGIGEARKTGEHDHVLLKSPDEARMLDELVTDAWLIEQGHHPVSVMLDFTRNRFSHERAFRIPPQQYLVVRLIPHQGQWIELTIERTLLVDAAG